MNEQNMETEFRVGRTLGHGFSVYYRNFVPFTIVAFAITLPLLLLEIYGATWDLTSVTRTRMEYTYAVADFLLGSVVSGALVYGTFQALQGHRLEISDCLSNGTRSAVAVIAISVVIFVIIILGYVALIIPGLMAMTVFAVAVPVTVVEKQGIGGALRRSRELTKGYGWEVFGLIVLSIFLPMLAIGFIIGFVAGFGAAFSGGMQTETLALIEIVLNFVLNGVFAAFYASVTCVMYHHLREAKEGVGIEELAAVFD